jgi:hypothetical protein
VTGVNRDTRRSGVETRARRRSSLTRALGQGGSVSAVAPAPCIGTAWAPRTSRAAFPVTASAFAIAWLGASRKTSTRRSERTIWSSPGGSARGACFARRSRASARIGSTRPSRPERSSRRGYWIADEPTVSVRWSEDRVGRLGPFAAVGLDCAAPDKVISCVAPAPGKASI